MPESLPKWLRFLPATLALLLLAEAAGAGLTLIRLRHDCAQSADAITDLRADMGVAGRRLQETGAQIANALRPDVLRDQVSGRLAPMQPQQIVWVRPSGPARPETLPLPSLLPQVARAEQPPGTVRPQ